MSGFLEAIVTLLPAEAGGRASAIAPREGNYCPALRITSERPTSIRFIEGPPWLSPGQQGCVVCEIDIPRGDDLRLASGSELDLMEGQRLVGIVTVVRFWRDLEVA